MLPIEDGLMCERYEVLSEWEQKACSVSPYITGETYPTTFWRLLLADGGTWASESDHIRQQLYESFQNLRDRNMDIIYHSCPD